MYNQKQASFLSPNGTPLELTGFQPDQSQCLSCARLREFQSRFDISCILFIMNFISGSSCGPLNISQGGAWASKDKFWCTLCLSGFSRIPHPNHEHLFLVLLISCLTNLCAIDAQSRRGHFPAIGFDYNSNPVLW